LPRRARSPPTSTRSRPRRAPSRPRSTSSRRRRSWRRSWPWGGTNESDCFGESPPLPPTKNGQTLTLTCLVEHNGAVTLPASCRSSKTNGGEGLHARVLAYEQENNAGDTQATLKGTEQTLTQRNPLINSSDPGAFARSLQTSDQNTTNLLTGLSVPDISGATSANPAIVHITILAFDPNPDTSSNPPNES